MVELVVNTELEGSGSKRERNGTGNTLVLAWKNGGISRKISISIEAVADEIRMCGFPKTSLNLS
jgi:hypothetical protein